MGTVKDLAGVYIVTDYRHTVRSYTVRDEDTIYGKYRWHWLARRRLNVIKRYRPSQ